MIPYGRGAAAIATQVKAETGTDKTVGELEIEITKMVTAWKEETYPTAWGYMQECAASIYDPGFLVNPWGRKRRFHVSGPATRPELERQAQNWPIQSTVADTAQITMDRMDVWRARYNMRFKLQNQIHDALMIEYPLEERDACIDMFNNTMGNIDIPVGGKYGKLRLAIDIDVYNRWGEKE